MTATWFCRKGQRIANMAMGEMTFLAWLYREWRGQKK